MSRHPETRIVEIEPRLLSKEAAAAYCSLELSSFSGWVARGIIPGPRRWDRKAIGAALDRLSDLDHRELSPLEKMEAGSCRASGVMPGSDLLTSL